MTKKRKEEVTDENAPENVSPQKGGKKAKTADSTPPSSSKKKKRVADDVESVTSSPSKSTPSKKMALSPKEKTSPSPKKTASPSPKKKKKGKKKIAEVEDAAISRGAAAKDLASQWSREFSHDKTEATANLLNFLIESCGCSFRLTSQQLKHKSDQESIAPLLKEIVSSEYLQKGTNDYPIISKKQELKKFKGAYLAFWNQLISAATNEMLFDDYFMDTLISWLTAFSNLKARPFRHTATITAMQIVSSLISPYSRFSTDMEKFDRLLKTEKKKQEQAVSKKVTQLTEQVHQYHQFRINIETMMKNIFKEVFVQRYRDVTPEIRTACILALGSWINELPNYFLDDHYLKYIGWTLFDRVAEVRMSSLEVLETLYKREDLLGQLNLFTQRFKPRIVEMTADLDTAVAELAIQVSTLLAKVDSLEDEQIDRVSQLITDDNCSVRHTAADFVKTSLFDKKTSGEKSKKGDKGSSAAFSQLRALLNLITESSLVPELPNYVVDALWSQLDVFTNWAAMTELLLTEEESGTVDERDQLLLVRLMSVCVQQATGHTICPKGKRDPENKLSDNAVAANKKTITQHFTKVLPQLLKKYQPDVDILEELVQIPQFFDLQLVEHGQKNRFAEMLNLMVELYLKHSTETFLSAAAKTFKLLTEKEFTFHREADLAIHSLTEQLVRQFQKAAEEEDQEAQLVCLKRISQLAKIMDLRDTDLQESLIKILQASNDLLIPESVDILYSFVLWDISSLPKSPKKKVNEMKRTRDELINQLFTLLTTEIPQEIKDKAFFVLCDLILLFKSLPEQNYEVPAEVASGILEYFATEMAQKDDEDTERKEKLIAALARTVVYNALPLDFAPSILVHFLEYGKHCTDLIKTFLSKIRETTPTEEWGIILGTLTKKYELSPKDTQQFKELSQRLAQSYGINLSDQLMDSLRHVIWNGLLYAFESPKERFPFLADGLSKFVSKLTQSGAIAFIQQLAKTKFPRQPSEDNEDDKPYFAFLRHLENAAKSSSRSTRRTTTKKPRMQPLEFEAVPEKESPQKETPRKQTEEAETGEEEPREEEEEEEEEKEEAEGAPAEEPEPLQKKRRGKRRAKESTEEVSPTKRQK